jgi:hypothetical protein
MIEVLKQALEALEFFSDTSNSAMDKAMSEDAITSLRQAIAELESQEPVAWMHQNKFTGKTTIIWDLGLATPNQNWKPLYTHPLQRTEPKVCCQEYDTCLEPCTPRGEHLAQRTWVELTDEETSGFTQHEMSVVKYVNKVLQEKNT